MCFCDRYFEVYTTEPLCYDNKKINSDGHQLHQYQQNEQSPLICTELSEHNNDMNYVNANVSHFFKSYKMMIFI